VQKQLLEIMNLDESFWTNRYLSGQTGWDTGEVTTPIKEYVDQLENKGVKILVPGCGNGHEVKYLYDLGFTNVHVIDISAEPLRSLQQKCPEMPADQFIHGDFFELEGSFDLILEQTFFSAFNPETRPKYADKMFSLLKPGGKLVGVLFNIPLNETHPPFGGEKREYMTYFADNFEFKVFDTCYNSITPRAGNELFINLQKPC
jgi:SAM-dependent methyltransferase